MYDIAIIGGGPAGLSAAIYALRAGKKTVIFEGNALGGVLNKIDKIENYPGFMGGGRQLAQNMAEQVMHFKPEIIKQFVIKVVGQKDNFTVYTNIDEYKAKRVIYCGGTIRAGLKDAEKFPNVSYCAICDGNFYRGKTVAVVGSGYTADEDVRYLLGLCKKVYLIGQIDGLEVEQFSDSIVALSGGEFLEKIVLKSGRELEIQGLFIALGGAKGGDILGYEPLEGRVAPGLYVAGDAGADFKQAVWACASGAKAATEAVKEK